MGSNQGNRFSFLKQIVGLIEGRKAGKILSLSKVYESSSWGYSDGDYLNMCLEAETDLNPQDLLSALQAIEQFLGRKNKSTGGERAAINYTARTADIDILFYNEIVMDTKKICIPHPLLQERQFVLRPLCDIADSFVHPVFKKSMRQLFEECKDEGKVSFFGEISFSDCLEASSKKD